MDNLEICRRLASAVSPWLYSEGEVPEKLNALYLKWINEGCVPEWSELEPAISESG